MALVVNQAIKKQVAAETVKEALEERFILEGLVVKTGPMPSRDGFQQKPWGHQFRGRHRLHRKKEKTITQTYPQCHLDVLYGQELSDGPAAPIRALGMLQTKWNSIKMPLN